MLGRVAGRAFQNSRTSWQHQAAKQQRLNQQHIAACQLQQRRTMADQIPRTDEEWKKVLTPTQFQVLRLKGTERAGTGEYNKHYEEGTYVCAGCKTPLYTSKTKFDSGCGWPAFYDAIPGAIKSLPDADGRRIEIVCAKCDGHMGHVFKGEGFKTPTDERHCVNSVSLVFHAGEVPPQ
ncbi:TPA: hypothetical protein N0F65_012314 [Lagenidium giganteum]|uniref:Peptide-methionine (R)-S-oxide reductase n=1 Tax=Lagenidium giganteum TaxID=4803 RepID=A0AAV2YQ07_9STRA|nr:TPA: hypothetical protein N0F65_012314 [Lagenidium giganteum]